jgi:hypothetical protein
MITIKHNWPSRISLSFIMLITSTHLYAAPSQEYMERGGSWLMVLIFSIALLFITAPISWSAKTNTKGKRILLTLLTLIYLTLDITNTYTLIAELPQQRNNDGFWVWKYITILIGAIMLFLGINMLIKLTRYYKHK